MDNFTNDYHKGDLTIEQFTGINRDIIQNDENRRLLMPQFKFKVGDEVLQINGDLEGWNEYGEVIEILEGDSNNPFTGYVVDLGYTEGYFTEDCLVKYDAEFQRKNSDDFRARLTNNP